MELNKQKLGPSKSTPSLPTAAKPVRPGRDGRPASLGTEMLAFAAGASANPLAARKTDKAALFSGGAPGAGV